MAGEPISRDELAQLCYDIFEVDRRGAKIFDFLANSYAQPAVRKGGIDAVLETYYRMGQRAVLDNLVLLINEGRSPVPPETSDEVITD